MRLVLETSDASGKFACFMRSTRWMRATRIPRSVTIGRSPFFDLWITSLAASRETPSGAVTTSSTLVITLDTFAVLSSTKSVSRLVTRPRSLEPITPSDVTGKLVKPHFTLSFASSESVISAFTQIGSVMKPLLYFFTFVTSATWSGMGRFGWMMPMPPSSASPMAIRDSVTVSMGLETIGVFNRIRLEKFDSRHTLSTLKQMCLGRHMMSSYVQPAPILFVSSKISRALEPSWRSTSRSGDRLRSRRSACSDMPGKSRVLEPKRLA
mmetsp:Transcript_39/g.85  ORF Transcript_39/g.85 Transcript_39/m.85 type:complete len:267 (-) Transcript_39:3-803(-)